MKKISFVLILCIFFIFPSILYGQLAFDTTLFVIALDKKNEKNSLFSCGAPGKIRNSLSGPIVMKDNTLIFYSKDGYVLYDQTGKIVDQHSLFQENLNMAADDPRLMILAFPLDPTTILYYQKSKQEGKSLSIFFKKLYRDRLKPMKEKEQSNFMQIATDHLFNLAHNSITDDMAQIYNILPQLIGFTSLTSGNKWWSIDKFYSFASPLINEEAGKYRSFFPGVKSDSKRNQQHFINPIQVFRWNKFWYYSGIYAASGTTEKEYSQTYYVVDPAGNILYADTLLKHTNRDAVIGEDEDTYYTVKKMERYVFQPTVDRKGNVYYGIIDYTKNKIEVHKRCYYTYKPLVSEPDLAHLIDNEKMVSFVPVKIQCNMKFTGGKTIPNITLANDKGERFKAQARHLTVNEYIVRIARTPYRDIEKKLSRKRNDLPENVKKIQQSLYTMTTVSCPYTVSLSGPKGMVREFKYTPGETMLSARVLAVTDSGEIYIRVDCETYAEILILRSDGTFVNRFIFNQQPYNKRKDLVVATEKSPIIELDYESHGKKGGFFRWERDIKQ